MGSPRTILALVALLLAAAPAFAQEPRLERPWWERARTATVGHYVITTDLPVPDANEYARHLNLTFEAYKERLGTLIQRAPLSLNVYIFQKQRDYLDTLRFKFGINGAGSGGMFFSNTQGTGLAFWVENLPKRRVEHVIQHEGFHQVAFALFGGDLPPWVNEGLAEFFGEGIMVNNRLVIGQTNPRVVESIKQAIEKNEYFPFLHMITMTPQTWNANVADGKARLQYEQAWSMVHFLVYGENGRYSEAFTRFLRHLNNGTPVYPAWVQAFGDGDLTSFEQKWVEFARDAKPSAFVTAMERIEFLAAGALELRQRGIFPETMGALKDELRAIEFTYVLESHGVRTELSALDDSMFTIPLDDLSREQPFFELGRVSLRDKPFRERRLEEEHPSPIQIATANVRPRNLVVVWIRSHDDPTAFTWAIVAR